MRRPDGNRPVDRVRNAGGQFRVPGDTGIIVAMFTTEHRMHFITERGLASAQMADQIDPERQNIDLPQVIQQLDLNYGADTPFIQRTLCVAVALFDDTYLPERVRKAAVLPVALEVAHDLAAVVDTAKELADAERDVRARLEAGTLARGIVPRTNNLRGRVQQAIGHLRAVQVSIVQIADIFFPRVPPNTPFSPAFLAAVRANFPQDDPAIQLMEEAAETLERIANYRNAMIHPDANKRLVITDYEMRPDGNLMAPTVEVVHQSTPNPRQDVVQFLEQWVEALASTFERLAVYLCDRSWTERVPGLVSFVAELPEDQRHGGTRLHWRSGFRDGHPLAAAAAAVEAPPPDAPEAD